MHVQIIIIYFMCRMESGDESYKPHRKQSGLQVCVLHMSYTKSELFPLSILFLLNMHQVIASKNSLLGLDIQEGSSHAHISSHHGSNLRPISAGRRKYFKMSNSKRKTVAEAVVKALSLYYRDKKVITSKVCHLQVLIVNLTPLF